MKNIHVLKTDKPSRLLKSDFKITLLDIPSNEWKKPNINIYITSDEEIKEGDWVMEFQKGDNIGEVHFINSQYVIARNIQKKIILTTDQDLIKDGVQAIDDDFLEWFVKNPSCEFVEIRYNVGTYNPDYLKFYEVSPPKSYYKIIIPKEEPKQETFEEFAENYLNKFYSNYAFKDLLKPLLIDGAKWQQERMYSEEEVRKAIKLYSHIDNELSIGEILQQFKKK